MVGIVAAALLRIAGRALGHAILVILAVLAFLALFVFGVPFPLVVLGAGGVGLIAGTRLPGSKLGATDLREAERVPPSWGRTARVLAIGLAVWLIPLAAVALAAGSGSVLAQEAVFFTIASLVTFGGAYAVLAYVNQAAVVRFGWLSASEMAVGLSLAESTPGPLIMVVVFVGFLAAYREPASLAPVEAGVVGALVVAWATFVPSFLWIFLGAPSVERLRGNERLSGALTAITASVVGVIANLAVVFATSVLFEEATRPDTVRPRRRGPRPGFGRPAGDRGCHRFVRRDPPFPRQRRVGDRGRRPRRARRRSGRVTVRRPGTAGGVRSDRDRSRRPGGA